MANRGSRGGDGGSRSPARDRIAVPFAAMHESASDAVDGAHSAASKCYRLVCVKARAIQGGEARKRRRRLKFEGIGEDMTTEWRQGRSGDRENPFGSAHL